MVQTVRSLAISPTCKAIALEKPIVLTRIFFSITAFAPPNEWHRTKVSFDDPSFNSFYILDGPNKYFEAKGEGIFQGNIWLFNQSTVDLLYTTTEILI